MSENGQVVACSVLRGLVIFKSFCSVVSWQIPKSVLPKPSVLQGDRETLTRSPGKAKRDGVAKAC